MLVITKTGTMFRPANFLKDVWTKAARASSITDKVPYSLRHSFAAWALTLTVLTALYGSWGMDQRRCTGGLHRRA